MGFRFNEGYRKAADLSVEAGLRQTTYDSTRTKLKVEGRQLQSLINAKSYADGELEVVTLKVQSSREKGGSERIEAESMAQKARRSKFDGR